jgi:carbonic anhydrase
MSRPRPATAPPLREPFEASHPPALAIYCSDGRFTNAVESLARASGHDRVDTLTLPGGPALLCPAAANLSEVDTVGRAAQFLIDGHKTRHLVLVAHQGCGYYRRRYPRLPEAHIEKHQLDHLALAAKILARKYPELSIERYYARVAQGMIELHPV